MDYPQLEAKTLTGIVTGFKVNERDFPFTSVYGDVTVDVPTLFARWDQVNPLREIVKAFEGRHAPATPTNPGTVVPKAQSMILSFKKRTITVEDLDVLRVIGGTSEADRDAALSNVDFILGDMNRRFRLEPMEYLIAGALQDNLSVTVDGVTISPDFGLPGSHDLVTVASWATPGTDIDADVETLKRLCIRDSGRMPTVAWMGENVPGYLRKNTAVKSWLTNFIGADDRYKRLQGDTFDLFGLTWKVHRGGYHVSGTWTPYLPADKVIVAPEPDRSWIQNQRGLVRFPTSIWGDAKSFGQSYGVASWSRVFDDPPAVTTFMRWAGLPCLVFPSVIANLDTTP